MLESLQSPKWDTKLVAEHNLNWLKRRGEATADQELKVLVGTLLHRMILDGQFTTTLCKMLDLWKAFADLGGMKKSDFNAIRDDQVTFAQATLLVSVIKDSAMALEGTLSTDLQECLRLWSKVRLG